MVVHEHDPWNPARVSLVTMIGPPATPAGSTVPEIAISRFGWVGPSTEQK